VERIVIIIVIIRQQQQGTDTASPEAGAPLTEDDHGR
jgi:hypothetical protein